MGTCPEALEVLLRALRWPGGWDGAGTREVQDGGDTCIHMASSFTALYSRNYHNIVQQLYSSEAIKFKKECKADRKLAKITRPCGPWEREKWREI